jgi:fucose permease
MEKGMDKEQNMEQHREKKDRNKIGVFLIFFVMLMAPFIENTRGIFIPIFKDEFGVSNTLISASITLGAISSMGFSLLGGPIISRIGQKKSILASVVLILAGILLQIWSRSFLIFAIGFVPISMGIALYNVSANTIVPFIFFSAQTVVMNILHSMYGIGSTVSQNLTGILLGNGIGWRSIYVMIAGVYLLIAILLQFSLIPDIPRAKVISEKAGSLMKNPLVYAFGFGLGFYAFSELGLSLWLTNYLKESYGFTESMGARYLGLFFLVFSVGRLLGGFVVQKFGTMRTIIGTMMIALTMVVTGLLLGEKYIIVISIAGIFYAIVFPSLISQVGNVFRDKPEHAMGYIVTLVSVGLTLMNQSMGILTDLVGARTSIFLIPFSMSLSILCMVYIRSKTKGLIRDGKRGTKG